MEKYLWKGQLADLKQKYQQLQLEVSGLIIQIRTMLNPFEEDVTRLPVEEIAVAAQRLKEIILEIRSIQEKIKKLEDAIG